MGDIIKLKIYSGRQQDAILRVPRQRSATFRAARPYAKFADQTRYYTVHLSFSLLRFQLWKKCGGT